MPNNDPQVIQVKIGRFLEIDAALTRFYFGMSFLEGADVVVAAGIERNIVLLVGDCHPAIANGISRHPVLQVDGRFRKFSKDLFSINIDFG